MERPRPDHRPARAGFTLVELLVAILIIAALLAILLPTLAAAFRRAKETQVSSEINTLASSLASFKNVYGDYPPSRVLLCEQGYSAFLSGTLAATVVIKGLCWFWCRMIKNSSVQALAQDAMTDVVFNFFSIIFPLGESYMVMCAHTVLQ